MDNKGQKGLDIDALFQKIAELPKLQRAGLAVGILVAILAGFYKFMYEPLTTKISGLHGEISQLETDLNTARIKAKLLSKYQKEIAEKQVDFEEARRALPEGKDIPSLLTGISRAGQEAGMEFPLFLPRAETRAEFYAEIPISLQVKGSFHKLAIFLDNVSFLDRIVTVRDINVKADAAGLDLTTDCTAVTYRFLEAAEEAPKGRR